VSVCVCLSDQDAVSFIDSEGPKKPIVDGITIQILHDEAILGNECRHILRHRDCAMLQCGCSIPADECRH